MARLGLLASGLGLAENSELGQPHAPSQERDLRDSEGSCIWWCRLDPLPGLKSLTPWLPAFLSPLRAALRGQPAPESHARGVGLPGDCMAAQFLLLPTPAFPFTRHPPPPPPPPLGTPQ